MSVISRLHSAQIATGNQIEAGDLSDEFDQLVNESNGKETRVVALESGTASISGVKTFTSNILVNGIDERSAASGVTVDGCLIKDGTVVPALASDPASLTDGQWWYNTTTDVFKGRVNGATVVYEALPSSSGNSGKALGNNGTSALWQTLQTLLPTVTVQDQKSATTNGGTFTSGAWRTRDLNTEVKDTGSIASVASNQVTLPAGTYFCYFYALANRVAGHQAIVYNVNTGATHVQGSPGHANTTTQINDPSFGFDVFTLTASNAIEVRHQCETTRATEGFGYPISFNTNVYTSVTFIKVA